LCQLKYINIREDFEVNKVPMKITLESAILKDKVDDRITFIGEDGFNTLREYLRPRMSMKDDDYLFERKKVRMETKTGVPLKEEREPYVPAEAFSMKFEVIALKLGWTERKKKLGEKNQIRMTTYASISTITAEVIERT
jgi:hypothetical protein